MAPKNGIAEKYLNLDQRGRIIAEYVWIDAAGETRSKSRTLEEGVYTTDNLPIWNFDGSSTKQAPINNTDVYLRPCAIFQDPIRGSPNIIVLAECWNADGTPNKFNFRHDCAKVMDAYARHEPWFGFEQEYTLIGNDGRPFGWPAGGFPTPQGEYYCGVGYGEIVMRDIVDSHYKACLYAGVKISGTNAEAMLGQWEFQVGLCEGIDIEGNWNGQGLHTNFSTKGTRASGGIKLIEQAMERLVSYHSQCIEEYGDDNDKRLTGRHETGHIDMFSWGVADRSRSIQIPRETGTRGYGYFEDRRPA
ncbi:glutamine synthetase [Trichoderma compactum]